MIEVAALISAMMSVVTFGYAVYLGTKITEVHLSLNSRLDEFLVSVRAEGVAAGREAQRTDPT